MRQYRTRALQSQNKCVNLAECDRSVPNPPKVTITWWAPPGLLRLVDIQHVCGNHRTSVPGLRCDPAGWARPPFSGRGDCRTTEKSATRGRAGIRSRSKEGESCARKQFNAHRWELGILQQRWSPLRRRRQARRLSSCCMGVQQQGEGRSTAREHDAVPR